MPTENENPITQVETPPVEAPEAPPPADAAEDADVLAAMDEGLAEAAEDVPEPDKPDDPPKAEDKPDKPADDKPEDEPDPVDAEIAELKLGERSAKRFRELSDEVKSLAPLREAAEKAGVDLDDLPSVFDRAKQRDEFVEMVSNTGASPEQFGKTLDYLTDIHAAAKGDVQAAERAFNTLLPEVQALASLLGKDIAGVADPLTGHDDLKQAVEDGDITRQHALELAKARTQGKLHETTSRQQQEQQQVAQEQQQARDWLVRFDQHMTANDPTYAGKRPMLDALAANIRATLPPAAWPEAVQRAYASIPAVVAPPAPKPRPGPVRPNMPPARMQQAEYDSMDDALEAGIRAASG